MVYLLDYSLMGVDYLFPNTNSFASTYLDCIMIGVDILIGEGVVVHSSVTKASVCVALALGCGLNAVIFASVAKIVANPNSLSSQIKLAQDRLNERMRILYLPKDVQDRLREFFNFRWHRTMGMEEMLFDDASENLRLEVNMSMAHVRKHAHRHVYRHVYRQVYRHVFGHVALERPCPLTMLPQT